MLIGYFEQEAALDNATTCIDEIWKEFPSYTQYEVRSALAKCGLTTKHIESQVCVLSDLRLQYVMYYGKISIYNLRNKMKIPIM